MSISDYLKNGQEVSFRIELPDGGFKFSAKVEEMSEDKFTIYLHDGDLDPALFKDCSDAVVLSSRAGLEYSLKVKVEQVQNNRVFLSYLPSRSHLRVNSYVILDYQVITGETYIEKRKRFIQNISHDTDDFLYSNRGFLSEEGEFTKEHTTADLVNEIKMLHKKVDFIINHLLKAGDRTVLEKEPIEVNLSGSGMQFTAVSPLKIGDYLDMKLVLPVSSGIVIELIAQVVRINRVSDSENPDHADSCEVGVKFAAINEDDREMIIRYTFKRQRELLRAFESSA